MAISTYKTYLFAGTVKDTLTKLCDIKEFPDMIGDPELLETTTLSNEQQTNILGIKGADILTFTTNYDSDVWDAIEAKDGELFYELRFGDDGDKGVFEWKGSHTLGLPGAGVNAVVDMTINIAASTPVVKKAVTP